MKNINKIVATSFFALIIGSGCQKIDFGTTNESRDVRDFAVPNTDKLFTNALFSSVGQTAGTGAFDPYLYVQYIMESQYTESSRYATTNADWAGFYANGLKDLANIIKFNSDDATKATVVQFGSNANQLGVARIARALFFLVATDRWGDIPYSKALNGETNLTPVYDRQQDIYTDLLKELKEAVAQFDAGAAVVGDPIYSGNSAKWKKFGNSLRMIMAMRMSKVDPVKAKAEFLAAFADPGGYINSNADNYQFNYLNNLNFRTPWNALYDKRDDYGIASTFMTQLNANADPRKQVFAQPTRNNTYVGIPYGYDRNATITFTGTNDYSRVGTPITGRVKNGNTDLNSTYAGKIAVVTASQIMFVIAEASANGWISTPTVDVAYNDAIKLSWDEWNITYTPAQLTTFVTAASNTLTGQSATEVRKRIGTQKWVALFPNAVEAWAEWRRTGYPALTPAPQAVNATKAIPRRYGYPLNEPLANPTNYAAAVAGIGGSDTHDVRVWWDKP
jgi:hypothetical protein